MTQLTDSKIHQSLLSYVEAGFRVIPLNGKVPTIRNWTQLLYDPFIDLKHFPGNFGIALDETHLIVDIDPRNFPNGKSSYQALISQIGVDLREMQTFTVQTGGGGYHFYFTKPREHAIRPLLKEYPGVEFKTKGHQVVGAWSIHPDTLKEYTVVCGDVKTIKAAPKALLDLIYRTLDTEKQPGIQKYVEDPQTKARFREFLKLAPAAIEGEQGDLTTYRVACSGKDLGLHPKIAFDCMVEIYNPRCEPPWPIEELKRKIYNAYKYGQAEVGYLHPSADFTRIEFEEKDIVWDTYADGVTKKKTLRNSTLMFFKKGSPLVGLLGYNQFSGDLVFLKRAPWHKDADLARTWTDDEATRCRYWMAANERYEPTIQDLHGAAVVSAREYQFHPVREYLQSLKWDGHSRLSSWLSAYCGVEDNLYTRTVGEKILVAAIARIFQPGCKFDTMLILEGRQGIGKSTICRILGGPWYGSLTGDILQKDVVDLMRTKWIIELEEMETSRKAETQAMRAFLSRQEDRVRLPYARLAQDFPRQSIFIGTINPDADGGYLKDTQNRRYWPVRVDADKVSTDKLRQVKDQLWAEAVQKFHDGITLHIEDPMILKMATDEQNARRAMDPWIDRIADWLANPYKDAAGKERRSNVVTATEVFQDCLNGQIRYFTRRESVRIAEVMKELNWTKGFYYHPGMGKTVAGYRRPSAV